MWTPRRIVLALLGVTFCLSFYLGYSFLLGSFDGLPPLPERFAPPDGSAEQAPPPPLPLNSIRGRLQLAFGPNCDEMNWKIVSANPKRGFIVAAERFEFVKQGPYEGWVFVEPVSIVIEGKTPGPDGSPDFTTFHAEKAYLKFDQPVRDATQLDQRKLMQARLEPDHEASTPDHRKTAIWISHNRKSLNPADDLRVKIDGPLDYFEEPEPGKPNISTTAKVTLTDYQNVPVEYHQRRDTEDFQTAIGYGLNIYMYRGDPPPPPPPDPAKPNQPPPKGQLAGVEKLELFSQVERDPTRQKLVQVWLWVESGGGNFTGGPTPKNDPQKDPQKAKPKELLFIETAGHFEYYGRWKDPTWKDPEGSPTVERAYFPRPPQVPGIIRYVTVKRTIQTSAAPDLLVSDYLDVFLGKTPIQPKKGEPIPTKLKETGSLHVKRIHAWGEIITVTSEMDKLFAFGSDLEHETATKRTTFSARPGEMLEVSKDNSKIIAPKITFVGGAEGQQSAILAGPGRAEMGEIDPRTGRHMKFAYWDDVMLYGQEIEKGVKLDRITLVGNAKFVDESTPVPSGIKAKELKLWLLSKGSPATTIIPKSAESVKMPETPKIEPKKTELAKKDDPTKGAKVHRLEATDVIDAMSAETVIRNTPKLIAHFEDVAQLKKAPPPPKGSEISPTPKELGQSPEPKGVVIDPKTGIGIPLPPIDVVPAQGIEELPPRPMPPPMKPKEENAPVPNLPPPPQPKSPLEISAQHLELWIHRVGSQQELDRAEAKGSVIVRQEPAKPSEKGTLIWGETLDLQCFALGNKLRVTGLPDSNPNNHKWAHTQFDKLTLWGFDIRIDQRNHTVEIPGVGQMDIVSETNLEGKKLEKPSNISVWWNDRMDFQGLGKFVSFSGNVQAKQEQSDTKSERMFVYFDREVYLVRNETSKTPNADSKTPKQPSENPSITEVHFYKNPEPLPAGKKYDQVVLKDRTYELDKLMKYQEVEAEVIEIENAPKGQKGSKMMAHVDSSTPGVVRIWQPGQKENSDKEKNPKGPPKPEPKKELGKLAPDEEFKLTVVQFNKQMQGENARNRAVFYQTVKVVHFPSERHDVPVSFNPAKLPLGAIYLECNQRLQVYNETDRKTDEKGNLVEKTFQAMEAEGNVRVVKVGELEAFANRLTYNESKGTLTFYGDRSTPAIVNRYRGQGIPPDPSKGTKIIYWVKTKEVEVIDSTGR